MDTVKRYELRLHRQWKYTYGINTDQYRQHFAGKTLTLSPSLFRTCWTEDECGKRLQGFIYSFAQECAFISNIQNTGEVVEIGEVWAVYDNYARRIA